MVILPSIKKMTLINFGPLFTKQEVVVNFDSQMALLLGGNGLGKTTILQSLVYGIAGGMDEKIEPLTMLRWDHRYFKDRIPTDLIKNSKVVVEFCLGNTLFIVERGFIGSKVNGLSILNNDTFMSFQNPDEEYKDNIRFYGNYKSFEDFRFLVHRLLYLAENRRGITWDLDSQSRILMLLNSDFINEEDFRIRRANLKRLDSEKRHIHVSIGKIEKVLLDKGSTIKTSEAIDEKTYENNVGLIAKDLKNIVLERDKTEKELSRLVQAESNLRETIHELSEKQRQIEANILQQHFQELGNTSNHLFIRKLLDHALCPACGEKSEEFRKVAQERARLGNCTICGTNHYISTSNEDGLVIESQLSEKINARYEIGLQMSDLRFRLSEIKSEETKVRTAYDIASFDTIPTYRQTKNTDPVNLPIETLESELSALSKQHEQLEFDIANEENNLNEEYEEFRVSAHERFSRLMEIFKGLASSFLGSPVSLRSIKGDDNFLNLSILIPVFNDIERETPEHCSEAQRFFLDIALRMSILELASELRNHGNTFICETPESALDVSYIDNVSLMFKTFVRSKHSLIASTNLQREGLAYKLLENATSEYSSHHVLDLLEIGNLSDVQRESKELKRIRNEILEVSKR